MKTIEEWLNELPEPYRGQALDNTKPVVKTLNCRSIRRAVYIGFIWGMSIEGFDYWNDLYESLPNNPPPNNDE